MGRLIDTSIRFNQISAYNVTLSNYRSLAEIDFILQALHLGRYKEFKEAVILALEFKTPKKASRQQQNILFITIVTKNRSHKMKIDLGSFLKILE